MRGGLLMKVWRGLIVVQKWPRKRGKSIDQGTRTRSKLFGDACRLSNHVDPRQMEIARGAAKASLMVPRDLIISAMYANLFDLELEDGRIITKRVERIFDTVFQGFALELTANFTFGNGSWETPTWPLPVRDTAGFWSAGAPDRITVPAGVTMMQFFGGGQTLNIIAANRSIIRIYKNGTHPIADSGTTSTVCDKTLVTAPTPVITGDFFQLQYHQDAAFDIKGAPPSFFGGIILEAG